MGHIASPSIWIRCPAERSHAGHDMSAAALALMRSGVHDYLMKSDLARLAPAET
jgi:hypothetical protein